MNINRREETGDTRQMKKKKKLKNCDKNIFVNMKLGEHKTKIQRWQKRSALGCGPIDMFTNERVSIELFYHTKNFSEAKKCFSILIECWKNNVEIPSLTNDELP